METSHTEMRSLDDVEADFSDEESFFTIEEEREEPTPGAISGVAPVYTAPSFPKDQLPQEDWILNKGDSAKMLMTLAKESDEAWLSIYRQQEKALITLLSEVQLMASVYGLCFAPHPTMDHFLKWERSSSRVPAQPLIKTSPAGGRFGGGMVDRLQAVKEAARAQNRSLIKPNATNNTNTKSAREEPPVPPPSRRFLVQCSVAYWAIALASYSLAFAFGTSDTVMRFGDSRVGSWTWFTCLFLWAIVWGFLKCFIIDEVNAKKVHEESPFGESLWDHVICLMLTLFAIVFSLCAPLALVFTRVECIEGLTNAPVLHLDGEVQPPDPSSFGYFNVSVPFSSRDVATEGNSSKNSTHYDWRPVSNVSVLSSTAGELDQGRTASENATFARLQSSWPNNLVQVRGGYHVVWLERFVDGEGAQPRVALLPLEVSKAGSSFYLPSDVFGAAGDSKQVLYRNMGFAGIYHYQETAARAWHTQGLVPWNQTEAPRVGPLIYFGKPVNEEFVAWRTGNEDSFTSALLVISLVALLCVFFLWAGALLAIHHRALEKVVLMVVLSLNFFLLNPISILVFGILCMQQEPSPFTGRHGEGWLMCNPEDGLGMTIVGGFLVAGLLLIGVMLLGKRR